LSSIFLLNQREGKRQPYRYAETYPLKKLYSITTTSVEPNCDGSLQPRGSSIVTAYEKSEELQVTRHVLNQNLKELFPWLLLHKGTPTEKRTLSFKSVV
ncbi:hypothetical protein Lal_00003040, partial [Lupinus albus]